MPRVMKQTPIVTSGTPGFVSMLICPAGHKYEVVGTALQTAAGAAPNYKGFLLHQGAAYQWVRFDQDGPTFILDDEPLGPLVLEVGDELVAYFTYTGVFAFVTYIDVSPV